MVLSPQLQTFEVADADTLVVSGGYFTEEDDSSVNKGGVVEKWSDSDMVLETEGIYKVSFIRSLYFNYLLAHFQFVFLSTIPILKYVAAKN